MYDLQHQLMTQIVAIEPVAGAEGLAASRRSSDLGVLGVLIGGKT
jgi:hypothetical protein